ncbi:MAG: LacI family DNA-binding transcriptional regulator, partial [Hungatella sp.]
MPTIKDIAIKAGVSHGTVSNVLNKRGNVSVEKINLVEKAAKELGFKLNTQAKQLRQGHTNRVCVLIPGLDTGK